MIKIINLLSRKQKQVLVVFFDIIFSILTTSLTFTIFNQTINISIQSIIAIYSFFIFNFLIIFILIGLYRQVFRYFNFKNIIDILNASFLYLIVNLILNQLMDFEVLKNTFIIFHSLLFSVIILNSRLAYIFILSLQNNSLNTNNVIIYGVNKNSVNLSNLLNNTSINKAIYFIEDSKEYKNSNINTIPVKSSKHLDLIIEKENPNEIIISDKYDLKARRNIIKSLEKYNLRIRSMPNFENISNNYFKTSLSKPLYLEDLVDREPIKFIDSDSTFKQKIVLVSGAGGSIGSEIVRQVIHFGCKKVILIDNSEFNLYLINKEINDLLESKKINIEIVTVLISIKDKNKLNEVFIKHKPDFVYHTAAFKHVFLLEDNIAEAIENNFFGTINILQSSIENHVSKFCFISTDKAVNPKTVMGSSKRLAELYIQSIFSHHSKNNNIKTIFSIVRFGNVFNSSGSVVPLFNKQINIGGPLTVTSENVERYFMSISEAVNLVLQSTKLSKSCSIFVLDMGSPIKIIDLAKKLIVLSGLSEKNSDNPNGDIEIKITGISSYEKMSEELSVEQNLSRTSNQSIFEDKLEFVNLSMLESLKDEFKILIDSKDNKKLRVLLKKATVI